MILVRLRRAAVIACITLVAVLATWLPGLHAQDQQPRTVSGLVEIEDNGRRLPVRRAAVLLSNEAAKVTLSTFTDNDGRYRFPSVATGRCQIEVWKAGFLQPQPAAAGDTASTLNIEMVRAAALEGRFIHNTGSPIPDLVVRAQSISQTAEYSAKTDDLGRFRIHTIPPGQYRIYATPPTPASGAKHFYPGTEDVDNAGVVTVVSGQTLDSLTVVVPTTALSAIANEAMATAELEAMGAPTIGTAWGQISGRVTRSDSGQPVADAAVKLYSSMLLRTAWTNGDGAYVFNRVMTGSYQVSAAADGHVSPGATPRQPSGTRVAISLGDGEKVKKDLILIPLSAIEGRVQDEFGDGVPGVTLKVRPQTVRSDDDVSPATASGTFVVTDDRGGFRAPGLTPGDYYVVALPQPFGSPRAAPFSLTYFPGAASAATAGTVKLSAGVDAYGVNLTAPIVRSTTLIGIAADPAGRSQRSMMRLYPLEDGRPGIDASVAARADDAGRFVFQDVPEGSYLVQASGGDGAGSEFVTVTAATGPEMHVRVMLKPLGTLQGRLTFEGERPSHQSVGAVAVRIQSVGISNTFSAATIENPASALIKPDFTFNITNIAWPGFVRVYSVPQGGPAWTMARVLLQGRDITDTPYDFQSGDTTGLEVVMTRQVGGIAGTVTMGDASNAAVTVIGADSDSPAYIQRTTRSAPVNKAGEFQIANLLPGRYVAYAIALGVPRQTTDSDPRRNGTPVVVSAGTDTPVRLTIVK